MLFGVVVSVVMVGGGMVGGEEEEGGVVEVYFKPPHTFGCGVTHAFIFKKNVSS